MPGSSTNSRARAATWWVVSTRVSASAASTSRSSAGSAARSIPESRRRARPCSWGRTSGQSDRAPTFRPFIGCMPAAGGGSRVPTSVGAFRPGQPVTRRVRTVRVRPGTTTVVQRCTAGERLVGASHAFAFATRTPPSASLVSSVSGIAADQRRKRRRPGSRRRGARGRARPRPGPCALLGVEMSFKSPWLLLGLLVLALAIGLWVLAERRRARYTVRYTNLDVLATVVLGALVAALCPAGARGARSRGADRGHRAPGG